jgi:hypothetical protein
MVKGKECGRRWQTPNLRYYVSICPNRLSRNSKPSDRINDSGATIQTGGLTNIEQNYHPLNSDVQ